MTGSNLTQVGKSSFGVLGRLSSKTTSECHLEPKAIKLIRIGRVSLPLLVNPHLTSFGVLCTSICLMNPFFSSSDNRIESTRGVNPGRVRMISLNLPILRKPISRMISIVHFLPRTSRLVLMGQLLNGTVGISASSFKSTCDTFRV